MLGFHDQRKILEFVKTYITKVNGDPTAVSAWGESAGGGSILHHLIAKNGEQDPFSRKLSLRAPLWSGSGTVQAPSAKHTQHSQVLLAVMLEIFNACNRPARPS